jgi:toxin ParE1/3/4
VKRVVFHHEAAAELRAAVVYYDQQRLGLGTELADEVEQAVEAIARVPQAFSPYGNAGIRRFIVRRFPYTVFILNLIQQFGSPRWRIIAENRTTGNSGVLSIDQQSNGIFRRPQP